MMNVSICFITSGAMSVLSNSKTEIEVKNIELQEIMDCSGLWSNFIDTSLTCVICSCLGSSVSF